MFRFVHAADLHLDTPFQAMVREAPEVARILQNASLDAFDRLVELTIQQDAAFLVIAGDIYDGAERGVRAQFHFLRGLERLSQHGIETFIIHGNHDPLDGWSAIRGGWPARVHVFDHRDPEARVVERNGVRIATVYGMSYATRDVSENLSLRYARQEAPGIHVGVLHCNVGSVADHAPYSPCTLDDLDRAGMHYWALGHIHKRQTLRAGSPWVVYAGTTQARSHKPSEAEPKGAMVITAEGNRIAEVEFVSLDGVRFVRAEVDIAPCADLFELHRMLRDHATRVRSENEGRGVLLRVTLTGRGPVHRDLLLPGKIAELTQELREEMDGAQPFLWWESIRRETLPDLDRAAIRERDDFSAELLGLSDALRATPESLLALSERFKALPAAAALYLASGTDHGQLDDLLSSAEDHALDLLEGTVA